LLARPREFPRKLEGEPADYDDRDLMLLLLKS